MKIIKDILEKNGIPIEDSVDSEEYLTKCPFCKTDTVFRIDKKTGVAWCENDDCGKSNVKISEYLVAFGISPEEKISDIEERPEKKQRLHLWSLSDILSKDFGEQDWIVDRLIPIETISMISGDPQNYKTWLTMEIARCVALGTPFLDKFVTAQGSVLVIDEEDHLRHIKKRLEILSVPQNAPIYYISQAGVKLDDDGWLQLILHTIKKLHIKLVIIDSFIRIHSGKENDAGDMARVFDKIREMVKFGTAVLLTHHHRKESAYGQRNASQSVRGSTDIVAALDCHISVEKTKDGIFVWQNKLRVDEAAKPFVIRVNDEVKGRLSFEYAGEMPEKVLKKDHAKALILDIIKEGEQDLEQITQKIQALIQIGKSAIGDALRESENDGKVAARKGDGGKKFYFLPEQPIA